ncbi:hypothetical protein FXO38_19866 [Capsicum annuum]|nr:hypothetical protein FXO38_19866 [Capsicum annuum]KAF3659685.1 hypothetical protein FXO37_13861 [Capsicum annuum]
MSYGRISANHHHNASPLFFISIFPLLPFSLPPHQPLPPSMKATAISCRRPPLHFPLFSIASSPKVMISELQCNTTSTVCQEMNRSYQFCNSNVAPAKVVEAMPMTSIISTFLLQ